MSTEDLRGPREVLGCLLDGCTWTHERTRPTQLLAPSPTTLRDTGATDIGGHINAAVVETLRHASQLDDQACREHLESHDAVEWAATIARLSAEVERLTSGGVLVDPADLRTALDQRMLHSHQRPGVWDDSNRPEIAGKPCVECAARQRLASALAMTTNPEGSPVTTHEAPSTAGTTMTVSVPPYSPAYLAASLARSIAEHEHFTGGPVDTIEVPDEVTATRFREALPAGSEVTVKVRDTEEEQ